jgi:two-component system cell cycle response regulator DivK
MLDGRRIFIVEDNLANRAIEQMLLERHGATTAIERYGRTTLDNLRAFAPVDMIIMDLMLPDGKTGFQVADEIRQFSEFDHVPIVAVTAADPAESMPVARHKGFAGFISKPFDFNDFPQQIARILNGEALWLDGD